MVLIACIYFQKNALAASNKVSIKVKAIAFAEGSDNFVTVGNRHVKFWYIEHSNVPDVSIDAILM